MSASTDYHYVIKGDYTQSDTANIKIGTDVCVVGDQNCKSKSGGAWAAISLKNISAVVVEAPVAEVRFKNFEFKTNNTSSNLPNINASQGFDYGAVTQFAPTLTFEMFTQLVANLDTFGYFTGETDMGAFLQVGSTAGNIMQIIVPHSKITAHAEGDHDTLLTETLTLTADKTPSNASSPFLLFK